MKTFFAARTILAAAGLAWLAGGCAQIADSPAGTKPETVIQVAPDGRDDADGSRQHPLASLAGARDRVRQLRSSGQVSGPVRIVFAAGRYPLAAPVTFGPEDSGTPDSPITYAGDPEGETVIDGGLCITGWKVGADGLWEAVLPEAVRTGGGIEALWVNGRRATRARIQNGAWGRLPGAPSERVLQEGGASVPWAKDRCEQTLPLPEAEFARLAALPPEELHQARLVVCHSWAISQRQILGLDAGKKAAVLVGDSVTGGNPWRPGQPYFIENVGTALDAPGEWFLSPAGTLRYMPRTGETPETAETVIPRREQFLVFQGDPANGKWLSHLRFESLHFRHAQGRLAEKNMQAGQAAHDMGAVVTLTGARGLRFENCEIAHTGLWAFWFRDGCQGNLVRRCHLHDLGGGGVQIGFGRGNAIPAELRASPARANVVDNCIIAQAGEVNPEAVGVLVTHAADNRITHNEIADLFYSGISIGWTWGYGESIASGNVVAYNHIHHLGRNILNDMAGIYTLGTSPGTIVRRNTIHDVESFGQYGWGIYTDEGSTGILIEDNLVYGMKSAGFFQHYGKENIVRNNIFVGNRAQQVECSYRPEPHQSFALVGNIICANGGNALGGPSWHKLVFSAGGNLYWDTAAQPMQILGKPAASWLAQHEPDSLVADPKFRDPDRHDYSLRPGSPAIKKLGFRPFDPKEAGVYGDPAWRCQAAQACPPQ